MLDNRHAQRGFECHSSRVALGQLRSLTRLRLASFRSCKEGHEVVCRLPIRINGQTLRPFDRLRTAGERVPLAVFL